MRFVDEYRAPEQVMQLIEHLRERASHLSYTAERPLRIMEVCGGHTHAIFKFGLDQLLPENVEFIHGQVVRCVYCRWVESTPAWRLPAIRKSSSVPLATPCAYQGNRIAVAGKSTRCRCAHRLLADGCVETGAGESNP